MYRTILEQGLRCRIIKIYAIGSYKRYMYVSICRGLTECCRIDKHTYEYLREIGVPTSQYYRYHK